MTAVEKKVRNRREDIESVLPRGDGQGRKKGKKDYFGEFTCDWVRSKRGDTEENDAIASLDIVFQD